MGRYITHTPAQIRDARGVTAGAIEAGRGDIHLTERGADMVIIWGTRLMGKVDVVPGMFYVATQFGHLNFVPLVPMKSYLVLSRNGDQFRGVPIPLSYRSIALTWTRTGLVLGSVVLSGIAFFAAPGMSQWSRSTSWSSSSWILPAAAAASGWTLFALTWHKFATRASLRRAGELAGLVGLNEAGYTMLQEIYGEAPPRAFSVDAPIPAEPVLDLSLVPVSSLPPASSHVGLRTLDEPGPQNSATRPPLPSSSPPPLPLQAQKLAQ